MAHLEEKGGLVILGLILMAAGLLFFLIEAGDGYSRWQERRRFIAVAQEASATVVSIRISPGPRPATGSSGGPRVPTVRFVDASGRQWTHEMSNATGRVYSKGNKLTVLYDPAKPTNVWDAPPSMFFVYLTLGISLSLIALGGALVFFFGRQRSGNA
jgi:hypothetical protein